MGLLSKPGTPLSWPETKKNAWIVHRDGIKQFLAIYHKEKDRKGDTLTWGDEVEYSLVTFDHELKKPKDTNPKNCLTKWTPEYASYMVEGTPGTVPYGGSSQGFSRVEANMKLRRKQLYEVLRGTKTIPLTLSVFPRLGCPGFTEPHYPPDPKNSASRSQFFPDKAIESAHPRWITLTRNIFERRGSKQVINIPVFKDSKTPNPFIEHFPNDDGSAAENALPDHIYMDCMGLGAGCCCLQITFRASDIDEARYLYDQLAVVSPIMLALAAASPIFHGYLADIDCRWNVLVDAFDDRTEEERGLKPLKNNDFLVPMSRYSVINTYLASQEYNDKDVLYNKEIFKQLKDENVDDLLAQHIAHLFIRDSISLFSEKLEQDIHNESDHFENIQSTNWQSMRFKPPPPDSTLGWRVEFRPLDVQITDFENAAFVVFVILLTRTILSFNLNFYVPITKMQDNFRRSQLRDAVNSQLFYFRKNIVAESKLEKEEGSACSQPQPQSQDHEYELMTADVIMNGNEAFPGLVPLVRMYVDSIDIDVDTRHSVIKYLDLISKRASGELLTTAAWIRKFVRAHPDYKQDSVVTDAIAYDLLQHIKDVSEETISCPELLGTPVSRMNPSVPSS